MDYLVKNQTLTNVCYVTLLKQLEEKIKKKKGLINQFYRWSSTNMLLLFNNVASNLLTIQRINLIYPHQSSSCFLNWKKELSSCYFAINNNVIDAVNLYLEDQYSTFYKTGIPKLQD